MNIVLYILLIILFGACSTSRPRQNRLYDSTVIIKDSMAVRAYSRPDGVDTVRYQKRQYSYSHSAGWRNKYTWAAAVVALMAAFIVIILKSQ